MAEFAALPLFTDAITADCAHLTDDEFGRYMRLLIVMWRSPGCVIPNDPQWICKRLRVDPLQYQQKVKPLIDEFCICNADAKHGEVIMQKRLSKEYDHVKASVEKRKAAAQKRWSVDNKGKNGMQSISNADAPTPTPTPTVLGVSKDTPKGRTPAVPSTVEIDMEFQNIWNAYPGRGKNGATGAAYKGEKKTARLRFETIYKNTKEADRETLIRNIIAGCGKYASFIERADYPSKHLSTWLSAAGWETDYTTGSAPSGQRPASKTDRARDVLRKSAEDLGIVDAHAGPGSQGRADQHDPVVLRQLEGVREGT